jgi:hypothetical protein
MTVPSTCGSLASSVLLNECCVGVKVLSLPKWDVFCSHICESAYVGGSDVDLAN